MRKKNMAVVVSAAVIASGTIAAIILFFSLSSDLKYSPAARTFKNTLETGSVKSVGKSPMPANTGTEIPGTGKYKPGNSKEPDKENINESNVNIESLLQYPMDEKSDYQDIDDREEVRKTAEGFFMTNYNVDFRDMGDYRQRMLYYFSSSSNGDQWVDKRISDIEKYTIVSSCKFLTDSSLVYIDKNYDIRVRGRLIVKYSRETDEDYLREMGLKHEVWYYRDLEIFLTLAVDNGMWERGDWTYLGCKYLSKYEKYQEGLDA